MVTIYPVSVSDKELFSLSLYLLFKKVWWLTIIIAVILVDTTEKYSIALLLAFSLLMIFVYMPSLKRRLNILKLKSSVSSIELDNDFVFINYIDGSYSKTSINRYLNAIKVKGKFYCLYKGYFSYDVINQNDFKTQEELKWFENNIFLKIKRLKN